MTIPATSRVSGAGAIIAAALGKAVDDASLACVYCRNPIPSVSFGSWSAAGRLQSAPCPDCDRRVTLTEAGVHHEFISSWWPGANGDEDAPARSVLDVKLDRPDRRIRVRGELDHDNVNMLASAMAKVLEVEPGDTVVDVRGLSFADATGLGALVAFARQLRSLGARLSVVGATPELRRLFDLVGLGGMAAST